VRRSLRGTLLCLSLVLILGSACYYYRLEQKLDSGNQEWLRRVGYIMTSEEKKLFLDLPADERETYKREFWARRDPDPATEENEFKLEYEERVEQADEMFLGEGRPGYLTDRGRIHILFGPPMDRITTPSDASGRAQEVWYYGNFPVVFVDEFSSGRYELVTYDLSALRDLNLMYMHELSQAQARDQQTVIGERGFFNFDWNFTIQAVGPERAEGEVTIEIPLAHVWFAVRDTRMTTTLDVSLEIQTGEGGAWWKHDRSFPLDIDESELQEHPKQKFRILIPVVLEGPLDELRQGPNKILVLLVNRTGGSRLRKVRSFRLKREAGQA
jgi:GWxTD domain-containing protein